jgi:triphosphoribosyl-dephospho-CoA synthetase
MVTPKTSGSHKDMDYDLMLKGAKAITPIMMEMYDFSSKCNNVNLLFPEIRKIGLKAEKHMFEATNHINTYKGLIFNMGMFVSAFSYMISHPKENMDLFEIIKVLSKDILKDFEFESKSFGYKAFKQYNITGARGEAHEGFPHVRKALELLSDFSEEERTETLAYLISSVEDTTLLKRAGTIEKFMDVRDKFKSLIKYDKVVLEKLDKYCLDNNLSFGGSADLLITTIFLKKLNNFYKL